MANENTKVQWAPRVKRVDIHRLYALDAAGIHDEELINEVGWSLLARCESFIEAMEAVQGRVKCPACGHIILRKKAPHEVLHCERCDWEVSWQDYHRTIQHKQLSGAESVLELFREYVQRFPRATDPRQKMLLIDRLIHGFHWNGRYGPTRAAAVNLIEGRYKDVLNFLDRLSYGEESTPGTRENLVEWREHVNYTADLWGVEWLRRASSVTHKSDVEGD